MKKRALSFALVALAAVACFPSIDALMGAEVGGGGDSGNDAGAEGSVVEEASTVDVVAPCSIDVARDPKCLGGACKGGRCQPVVLVAGEAEPDGPQGTGLVIDDRAAWFRSGNKIRRVPFSETPSASTIEPVTARDLAADADFLYALTFDNQPTLNEEHVVRVPKEGPNDGGLALGPDSPIAYHVAAGDNLVSWGWPSAIRTVTRDGADAGKNVDASSLGAMTIAAGRVFAFSSANAGSLYEVGFGERSSTNIDPGARIRGDGTGVVFSVLGTGVLLQWNTIGPDLDRTTTLADDAGATTYGGFALERDAVYVTAPRNRPNGRILRIARDGSRKVDVVAESLDPLEMIAVSKSYLAWITIQGNKRSLVALVR